MTNRKISAAKLHIAQLKALPLGSSSTLVSTYRESVVYQLMLACYGFVCEIAADYHIVLDDERSFAQLQGRLDEAQTQCHHCRLLADMESQSQSWIYQLQAQFAQSWQLDGKVGIVDSMHVHANVNVAKQSLIAVTNIQTETADDQLQSFLSALQLIIAEYREHTLQC